MQARTVIDELTERGFVSQMTETGLAELAKKERLVVYCGFDPTAPSLHLGHVVPIMALAHVQRYGGKSIFLIGGATAQIGDPSGKQSERTLLSKNEINQNAESIKKQLSAFLKFESENPAELLNNADWLENQTLISFLRDTAKHFSLGYMLAKESVKSRIEREQGISITEFLYGLLQSFDFWYLNKYFNCNVQIGGSDQWGNITAGIDYIRKMESKHVHGLTFPLLTKSDGSKFGKTETGAVWLDPTLTTPYQMYQYWLNTDDKDAIKFLKLFTFLPLEEISQLDVLVQNEAEKRKAQATLAFEFTKMVHGEKNAKTAETASEFLFGSSANELDIDSLNTILDNIPSLDLNQLGLKIKDINVVDALVLTKLAQSKGEARKIMAQGGLYVNNIRQKEMRNLTDEDFLHSKAILLRSGKKNYAALSIAGTK
ncbi:hypothetical protein CHS0354_000749 [Potamilus streckersoni]|uniref:Tyrosine--tRNA ligase n=1 Tax=Potamilus streckersoni TaxID=2493646 RepID=A0AAE0W7L2_9BIVA|nr:hypothetical protein CHS0354_000749 [Potamilus streckersoni]